ncbi:MAG: D-alanyl-D-alanine carboxypeptidase/D-alanyl-D-alanine endopeptidase [Prochlorococcaceae cyanobacterium]|jgi:D-alanyl-D-alanine carboxypeptidase/D-alanyl-D-alanine-endopeptidase (penicillin-binding protein 4)
MSVSAPWLGAPVLLASLLAAQPVVAAQPVAQHPSLPAPGELLAQVPLAALPLAPPPLGLPQLQQQVSCPALQQRLAAVIGSEARVWSVSVAAADGRLLADVNGLVPRIPASNQKLISTAYALDQLGPDHRLRSQLWRLGDGSFRLTGEGDPDLALPQLQRFAKLALGSGGSSGTPGTVVRLQIAEEPKAAWWPTGWDADDRYYAYGAPVTRLAVTSNAIHDAVMNPPSRLSALLQRSAAQQGGKVQVSMVSARQPLPADAVLLHEEPSASMHSLLSLANTESHNFTAEVLLRQAADSWDLGEARQRTMVWLSEQGLPMQGVRVADGSGLDRANRVTSRMLAALLLRMDHHPYSRNYLASMAVAGRRGTLRNLFKGSSLEGRFFGKTGTIRGVRSISGVLETPDGLRYVSAISNGAYDPNSTIGSVLRASQTSGLCP